MDILNTVRHAAVSTDRSKHYRWPLCGPAWLTAAILLVSGLSSLCNTATALAAPVTQSVGPGQVQRQIEDMPSPQTKHRAVPLPAAAKTQVAIQTQTFVLSGVLIEGATAFSNLDFLPFYQSYLGKKVTLSDLRSIADAITQHYHQAGYFLSHTFLPAQRIEFGIVRIRVAEGYISDWKITGGVGNDDAMLNNILNPVTEQRPLLRTTLDKVFQNLSLLPDVIFHPYVRPVQNQLGAYDLVLDTEKRRFGGSINIDNHGSEYLGPFQGVMTLQTFDLTGHHESYQFSLAGTAHTGDLLYADIGTDWLLGDNGARFLVSAAHTIANLGGSLKSLDARIENSRLQLTTLFPLRRMLNQSTYLGLSIDMYRSRTDLYGTNRLKDHLTSVVVSVRHAYQPDEKATHSMGLSLTKGLKIADSEVVDTQTGAGIGRPDFFKVNLYYSYLRIIRNHWALTSQIDGQYAANTLPNLETYSIGGQNYGRAYDPAEITGDSGLAGRLEIANRHALTVAHAGIDPYVFYDLGKTWRADSSTGPDSASLASGGLGVRAGDAGFSAYLEVDKPLTRKVASEGTDGKGLRVFGGVTYQF